MNRDKIKEVSAYVATRISETPRVALVLGSGIDALVEDLERAVHMPFETIPHFVKSTLRGHPGELVFGHYRDVPVIIQRGRYHFYEGYPMDLITFPIQVFHALGIEQIILTNACGGINTSLVAPGDILVLNDFINLMPSNPLIGPNDDSLGPRFPDMTEPYDLGLRHKTEVVFDSLGLTYKEGVYAGFMGPYYETKAEIKMIESFGADVVGMSTVPETITANHLGMNVLAFAMVTNMATGIQKMKHSHDNVVRMARESSEALRAVLKVLITQI